jgi:hypothetical protein
MAKDGDKRQTRRLQIGNWGQTEPSGYLEKIIIGAQSSHNAIKNVRLLPGFNRKHLGKSKPASPKPEVAATRHHV